MSVFLLIFSFSARTFLHIGELLYQKDPQLALEYYNTLTRIPSLEKMGRYMVGRIKQVYSPPTPEEIYVCAQEYCSRMSTVEKLAQCILWDAPDSYRDSYTALGAILGGVILSSFTVERMNPTHPTPFICIPYTSLPFHSADTSFLSQSNAGFLSGHLLLKKNINCVMFSSACSEAVVMGLRRAGILTMHEQSPGCLTLTCSYLTLHVRKISPEPGVFIQALCSGTDMVYLHTSYAHLTDILMELVWAYNVDTAFASAVDKACIRILYLKLLAHLIDFIPSSSYNLTCSASTSLPELTPENVTFIVFGNTRIYAFLKAQNYHVLMHPSRVRTPFTILLFPTHEDIRRWKRWYNTVVVSSSLSVILMASSKTPYLVYAPPSLGEILLLLFQNNTTSCRFDKFKGEFPEKSPGMFFVKNLYRKGGVR